MRTHLILLPFGVGLWLSGKEKKKLWLYFFGQVWNIFWKNNILFVIKEYFPLCNKNDLITC